jgi:hypothetical protein
MGAYYYIVSSLSFLSLQRKPPLSYSNFLELCSPWLRRRDLTQLHLAKIDIENIPLNRRADILQVPKELYLRLEMSLDASAIPVVHQVLQETSPHRIEIDLLQVRWDFLTRHEVGHYFDLALLIIYALKLQLLERMQKFDEEKGKQVLRLIYERSLDEN